MSLHNKKIEEIVSIFDTDLNKGLSNEEAKKRLEKNGKNELKEANKKTIFQIFFEQINDVMIYVLIVAAVITTIVNKEFTDAIIILLVVIVNAVVGVTQELKAGKALEALKKMTNPKAVVIRSGKTFEINSSDLVVGDIVLLDAGRVVPADLRLVETSSLQIEESSFTGESVPVNKDASVILEEDTLMSDRINLAFMSTLVSYGRAKGVVIATSNDTQIGKIADMLDTEDEKTPLQVKMNKLGKQLGYIAIVICVLIFVIGIMQKRGAVEMLITSISLAVAAIPEGLVAIIAIVLSLGVTRMSKKNAIIKKLPAVETLGSVNYICSDKTGTLTQNKMTVVKTFTKDIDENLLTKAFILSSDAKIEGDIQIGDPTELALIAKGINEGILRDSLDELHPRVDEYSFDSDRKLMSTLVKNKDSFRVYTKGALDNLLKISTHIVVDGNVVEFTDSLKEEVLEKAHDMAKEALRVLAVAYKDTDTKISSDEFENNLVFIGISGMIDPPRMQAFDSIKKAHKAGIAVVMITGDHKDTAFAIAKNLNIASSEDQTISGPELEEMSDEMLEKVVTNYRVFSRVSPVHKVRIVKALRKNNNIVSMTGDGVNDAPSLKSADIGVAMGITGTDVAKGASSMILTDDDFSTIVVAIEEGRNIYDNIKKAIIFLLSCNLGEVISIFIATILAWPIPLIATQILWINLVTDSLPALALGVDPISTDQMSKKPRDKDENFFSQGAWFRALVGGTLIGTLTLSAFVIGLIEKGYSLNTLSMADEPSLAYARTMAFIVLTVSQLFYAYTTRSSEESLIKIGIFKNKFLNYSLIIGLVLQFSLLYIPVLSDAFKVTKLSIFDLDIVILFALIPVIVNELIKKFIKFK
ncbi:cation-translocating P-type ATPase [Oceanivirga miroungae]|uniref:Mg2+ transport protein n=1 Tax=Oceanivirga miroungae TaxID=1130046 RepID=A0A6I8MCS3_9FUSO|nr:cation-translocating P-type ATPase [Oceanivirga miroungae]VWL85282.1 Mg2+ transport protein [Oceanivirga miroungae]